MKSLLAFRVMSTTHQGFERFFELAATLSLFAALACFACGSPSAQAPTEGETALVPVSAEASDRAFDLVFVSERGGSAQLYRLDLENREVTRLTAESAQVFGPRWVEQRSAVVFARRGDETLEAGLYTLALDGTAPVFLMANPAGEGSNAEAPEWSDGGRQMVYAAAEGGAPDLFVANAEGERLAQLTEHPASDVQPRFSPDGTKVAFISDRQGNPDLLVLELGTGQITNLTASESPESDPEWSPDGKSLLFRRSVEGESGLYLLTLEDGALTYLTASRHAARFSPDGAWIAFAKAREVVKQGEGANPKGAKAVDEIELFRMRPDGTELERLTDRDGLDHDPIWVPREAFETGG